MLSIIVDPIEVNRDWVKIDFNLEVETGRQPGEEVS